MVQMVMGVRFGAPANSETMLYLKSQLPENSVWAAFGIGRMEYPMLVQAFVAGGHVRVGMEDNLYIKKGELFSKNNLTTKRPLKGIDASNWFNFLNKKAKKNYIDLQVGDVLKTAASTKKIDKFTGKLKKINISQGINLFVNWYKNYVK